DDYYGILLLKKDCTDDQIKKRYKKLARLTHPDQNKWPDSQKAFQMLGLAYGVLKDPSKRRSYD
ncbi:heat shock protein DnaJ, partial [Cadophora sp. DSE1049]